MKLIVKLFGMLMLVSGISLLIKPEIIFVWIEKNMENPTLQLFAIVVRLVLGILFIVTAKASKYPSVIKFFGYLFIIAAFIFTFLSKESFEQFITTVLTDARPFTPVVGLLAMAFGGFLIYAFSRNKEIGQK